MVKKIFTPQTYDHCSNFENSECLESENIKRDFNLKIEMIENENLKDLADAGYYEKIVIEISEHYCKACSNFSAK